MSYNQEISSVTTSSVPHIVVTEPSPVTSDKTPNTVSVVRKIVSIPENVANGAGGTSPSVEVPLEQASNKVTETNATVAATSEPSTSCGSGEFTPAAECNDCVVPLPEQPSSQSVEDAATTSTESEPAQDYFRTADVGCCANYGLQYIECYEKVWNTIHSGYALPFWLLLLALPVSAGYMSALYMYSCPASHSMSMLMFTIGISLMAVFSLRICVIIRRMTTAADDFRNMLHTLLLVSSFLTVVFFITESVAFWKLTPSSDPGTPKYCDPHFVTFSFWWNCIMCVVIVPIFLFPA